MSGIDIPKVNIINAYNHGYLLQFNLLFAAIFRVGLVFVDKWIESFHILRSKFTGWFGSMMRFFSFGRVCPQLCKSDIRMVNTLKLAPKYILLNLMLIRKISRYIVAVYMMHKWELVLTYMSSKSPLCFSYSASERVQNNKIISSQIFNCAVVHYIDLVFLMLLCRHYFFYCCCL